MTDTELTDTELDKILAEGISEARKHHQNRWTDAQWDRCMAHIKVAYRNRPDWLRAEDFFISAAHVDDQIIARVHEIEAERVKKGLKPFNGRTKVNRIIPADEVKKILEQARVLFQHQEGTRN
jgi:hypothetical protein